MRPVFLVVSGLLGVITMALISYSLSGFSMNQRRVLESYWTKADLPELNLDVSGTDYEVKTKNLDLKWYYGLRLIVQTCDGKFCNDNGDDIVEDISSFRIQSCYDEDDDEAQRLCFQCRDSGLAAGSFDIIALFTCVVGLVLTLLRFSEDNDSTLIKWGCVGMYGATFLFTFLTVAVYGGGCYQKQVNDQFSEDDFFDEDDVNWSLGPAFISVIVAVLLTPIAFVLQILVPPGKE